MTLILTCEHGGNDVPAEYDALFQDADAVLISHRGWDPGALELACEIAAELETPIYYGTWTRLLVELNRSLGEAALFSEFTRDLPEPDKQLLVAKHWHPFRHRVESHVGLSVAEGGHVLHLSVHTFTPELGGVVRDADIGILFDPSRKAEVAVAQAWKFALETVAPELVVKFNYPYLGTDDGHTTGLRRRFPDPGYAGIELEVNQKFPLHDKKRWAEVRNAIIESLRLVVDKKP